MARVAILGANGMLGHVACRILAPSHHVVAVVRRAPDDECRLASLLSPAETIFGIDMRDFGRTGALLRHVAPDVVLNCVGLVKQRPEAGDKLLAIELNALLPHRLARACSEIGAKLVQVSTDCVFSGLKGRYTESDVPDPIDTYGRSKLLGECTDPPHLTLRTSIVGPQLEGREGLVAWFLAQRGRKVMGYRRAIFSGLTTIALAKVLHRLFTEQPGLHGLYHVAAAPISKHDLLTRLALRLDWKDPIEPVDVPVIDRSLDGQRFAHATGILVPSWDEMLDELVESLVETAPVTHG